MFKLKAMKGMMINEAEFNLENGGKGKIAVFIYTGGGDPEKFLDQAVNGYVEHNGHHQLIDANLDNPWIRVVVSDINRMHQEQYDPQKHKMFRS